MTRTSTEAAALAGVSTRTIRRWAANGTVSATKTAGRWVIDADSLHARCADRIAAHADYSPYKDKARAYDKVVQLLEDGALVSTSRTGLYQAVSSDGSDKYLVDTLEQSCQCRSWLGRTYCTHLTGANAIEASKGNTLPLLDLAAA